RDIGRASREGGQRRKRAGKTEEETPDHRTSLTPASHEVTCAAMRPRLPSITRRQTASPGARSAKPDRRSTSIWMNTSSGREKMLAKPKPLALSNHFT